MLNIDSAPDNRADRPRRSWLPWTLVGLACVMAVVGGFFVTVLLKQQSGVQARTIRREPPAEGRARRQGPGGPGVQPERKVVAQFDKNGDGRLDTAERTTARTWLSAQGDDRRRPFGGRYAPASPGPRLTPRDVRAIPGAAVYDPMALRTAFLQFEGQDWETELAAFYHTDVEVPATLTIDGQTFRDIGVHFRGNSSFRMVPAGSKRSLSLALDFVHDGQNFGGYRSFNFLNANGDPTFLRAVLYSEIARHYIPTAKANFIRVAINGESWGLYVNAEQFNKEFLQEEFGTTKGTRWKVPGSPRGRAGLDYLGDDPAPYRALYEIKTKDDPRAWKDLAALCRVLKETPLDQLEQALAPILDVDGVLKFLALEVVLDNSDGYWARASDYAIYQDPDRRFHILPNDFNEGFAAEEGRGFGGGGGVELNPLVAMDDAGKPLRSRLLAVPALRARYLGLVKDIATRWLDWKTLGPLVRQYRTLIADAVKADTGKLYTFEAFEEGVADAATTDTHTLRGFAERRRAFLLKP